MGFEVAPPRADHLELAKYIIIVLSVLFVPFLSILFGSTVLSLGFSYRGKQENNEIFTRFSHDLVKTFIGSGGVILIMVLLPIVTIAISFGQVLYGTEMKVAQYFMVVFASTFLAVLFTNAYKKSFANRDSNFNGHLALGGIAILLFHVAIFSFVSTVTFAAYPENWKIITTLIPITYEWNMIARFAHFMTMSIAITGGAILFFFFNWMGGKDNLEGEYGDYVRKFGGGITMGFTIIQTIFFMWYLATLPETAKSYDVYTVAILSMAILWAICFFVFNILYEKKSQYGKIVFPLLILFTLLVTVDEHFARENSLAYQNYKLNKLSSEFMAEVELKRLERSGGGTANIETGLKMFNEKCSICHSFDQKLVGPSYMSVLPKYEGNQTALQEFILNPIPVNPEEYPSGMINQGLKKHEAESAAMYLLDEYQKRSGGQ